MCHAGWEESSRARRLLLYTPLPPPGNAPGACETARRWVKGKGWEGRERQTCLTYLFKPTAGGADYSCRAKRCVCVCGDKYSHIIPLFSLSFSVLQIQSDRRTSVNGVPAHLPHSSSSSSPSPASLQIPEEVVFPVAGQSLTTRHLWWDSNPGHKKIKLHRLFQSKGF